MSSYDDYERYLAVYEGDLFVFLDDEQENDDREHPAGQVRLFVLNADAAENEGESLFDVLDEWAETATYIHLLGDDAGNFSGEVCKILGEEMVFSIRAYLATRSRERLVRIGFAASTSLP